MKSAFHLSLFRTQSFDDIDPRSEHKVRKSLKDTDNENGPVQKDILDPDVGRQRSWYSDEISKNINFGTSSKKSKVHIAPIVIISAPVNEEKPIPVSPDTIDLVSNKKYPPSLPTDDQPTDLPSNHNVQQKNKDGRRTSTSIVKGNFRKFFGKEK